MSTRWTIHVLALFGVVASVIYLVITKLHINDAAVAAGPISKPVIILFTILESVWILIPYLVLARLNESHKNRFEYSRMFVLLVIVILFLGVYMMLDIVVFNPDPLGGVAMIFWVPIQSIFIVVAWGACKK